MKNFTVLHFAFVITLAAPVVHSASTANTSFDTNKDGQVSAAELQAGLTALFAKMDSNNDGYLTLSEVQAWRDSAQVEHFNALDTDKSTTLSLAELQANTASKGPGAITANLFALLDADSNSSLSWSEFSIMEPGKGETIMQFADMDADADKKISQSEFLSAKPARGAGQGPRGEASGTTTK